MHIAQKQLNAPNIQIATRSGATATGSGEQTLYTFSIPANTLSTNKGIRVRYHCRRTTGSGSVVVTTKYNGTRLDANSAVSTANWTIDSTIWGDNSTSAQRSVTHQMTFTNGTVTHLCGVANFSVDQTSAINLTVNCTLTTSSDVVTLDWIEIYTLES